MDGFSSGLWEIIKRKSFEKVVQKLVTFGIKCKNDKIVSLSNCEIKFS